jgi:V8-like Glu-specific endopeptidase
MTTASAVHLTGCADDAEVAVEDATTDGGGTVGADNSVAAPEDAAIALTRLVDRTATHPKLRLKIAEGLEVAAHARVQADFQELAKQLRVDLDDVTAASRARSDAPPDITITYVGDRPVQQVETMGQDARPATDPTTGEPIAGTTPRAPSVLARELDRSRERSADEATQWVVANASSGDEYLVEFSPEYLESAAETVLEQGLNLGQVDPSLESGAPDVVPRGWSNATDNRVRLGPTSGPQTAYENRVLVSMGQGGGCTGTVVGPRLIITAAHCLLGTNQQVWFAVNDPVITTYNGAWHFLGATGFINAGFWSLQNGVLQWVGPNNQLPANSGNYLRAFSLGGLPFPGLLPSLPPAGQAYYWFPAGTLNRWDDLVFVGNPNPNSALDYQAGFAGPKTDFPSLDVAFMVTSTQDPPFTEWAGVLRANADWLRTGPLRQPGFPANFANSGQDYPAGGNNSNHEVWRDVNVCSIHESSWAFPDAQGFNRVFRASCDISGGHSGGPVQATWTASGSRPACTACVVGVVSAHACTTCAGATGMNLTHPATLFRITGEVVQMFSALRLGM